MTALVERTKPVIRISDLHIAYRTANAVVHAVNGVDLEVAPGRITAVVGESGSGKSTLALAIMGLLPGEARIDSGRVEFQGADLTALPEKDWHEIRGRQIGLIPQDPTVSLDPVQPVGALVAEVLRIHGLAHGKQARVQAIELLAEAGLPEPDIRARQYPHELSGGMRQRVLIAMAMAGRPRLLVADEPTSALDVTVQRRILDHLQRVVSSTGVGIVLITHDLAVAAERSDNVVVMSNGRVVESGPTAEVLGNPTDSYTQQLIRDSTISITDRRARSVGGGEPSNPAEDRAIPLVEVGALVKKFQIRGAGIVRRPVRTAVDDVSFVIPCGRTLGLVGESGSGKTTIARLVLGLERPGSGFVHISGQDVTALRGAKLRQLRRRIQLVYQNPYASLNPRFSVEELLIEPLRNFGIGDKQRRAETVRTSLDSVALSAATAQRKISELSGGQRQRVAIARALTVDPELLVCDEPVSALDVTVQRQILDLLLSLQQSRQLSYLFISHDLGVIRYVSDDVAVLQRGTIVESGPAEQVFTSPGHTYTQELLAAVPGAREYSALVTTHKETTPWT
ncbi:dipeptide ABC transporter ATP-binding protein [Rhodococcoides yunnanense]|uniref:dipeptide ABC transporter ATP-binding protein n=1 Tax=Rhodococcoides yunnanense TaxID=278209 RepID=UPI000935067E|nr:ABC transporter ATP-binding protein [Rhodococcus yunnanensis]